MFLGYISGKLNSAMVVIRGVMIKAVSQSKLCVFPGGSYGKESACSAGDLDSISGLGTSPGEGNGYPLQYFHLENSMDRGSWWVTVHGVTKIWTRLSN